MKHLILTLSLLSTSLCFAQCPNLAGSYHCMFEGDRYSLLVIQQRDVGEGAVEYTMDLTGIPGDPDVIVADSQGQTDSMGWINKCSKNKIIAIPHDGSMLSEMYLDHEKAFVRTHNGTVAQKCPRKLGTL